MLTNKMGNDCKSVLMTDLCETLQQLQQVTAYSPAADRKAMIMKMKIRHALLRCLGMSASGCYMLMLHTYYTQMVISVVSAYLCVSAAHTLCS